jgi:hypothetical protein
MKYVNSTVASAAWVCEKEATLYYPTETKNQRFTSLRKRKETRTAEFYIELFETCRGTR